MEKYYPRIADNLIAGELEAFGAVLVEGPKWCGKTTTAAQHAKSILYMQDPDNQESYLQLASMKPSLLLQGDKPRLIDEWQMAPSLWDAIRHDVDLQGKEGLYLLTGSTSVEEQGIKHSGAGRISRLKMYPMSLYEQRISNGAVSLKSLFDHTTDAVARCESTIEDYARFIVRGGWPNALQKSDNIAFRQIARYCETITTSDIRTVDGVQRDKNKTQAILRSYARNIATSAPKTTLLSDVHANHPSMHMNTLDSYITAMERLFLIDELPSWSPKLRSKTTIRASNTRHFIDPAIGAYFLQAKPEDLLYDLNTYGFLFESLVIRDLRVYSQALEGDVFHYRDKDGLEADAIIHLHDGRWAAVEVKLGSAQVEDAAKNLKKLEKKIDVEHMHKPAFLMVVTGTQYAYQREDGIVVVPLACLKP